MCSEYTYYNYIGIDNVQKTYLVLYNDSTLVDYANVFTIGALPTTLPPPTTTITTLPPNTYSDVQFAISAPFSLVDTATSMANYKVNLKGRIVYYTDVLEEDS